MTNLNQMMYARDDWNPNWRKKVQNNPFYDKDDEIAPSPWGKWKRDSDAGEVEFVEYYNPELKEPALKTVAEEIGLAGQPKDLTQY